jgi:hypothetical protein
MSRTFFDQTKQQFVKNAEVVALVVVAGETVIRVIDPRTGDEKNVIVAHVLDGEKIVATWTGF